MMKVPAVRLPPAASPAAIARKSHAVRTAWKGRCIALLSMTGMASYGASPLSEFIYSAAEIRKPARAMMKIIILSGWAENM